MVKRAETVCTMLRIAVLWADALETNCRSPRIGVQQPSAPGSRRSFKKLPRPTRRASTWKTPTGKADAANHKATARGRDTDG